MPSNTPLVGITSDLIERSPGRWSVAVARAYGDRVVAAGGIPVLLPPDPQLAAAHAAACDAFVFTGGNDPNMRQFGRETHPSATLMHPQRQEYETTLLCILRTDHPTKPVLGICLGMQMMCLDAGGELNQHLPDTHSTAAAHRDADHPITPVVAVGEGCPTWLAAGGMGNSNHHQAVANPGRDMRVLAVGDDGVIEAVVNPQRQFYVGVQWHPERTADERLGADVFRSLVQAAKRG